VHARNFETGDTLRGFAGHTTSTTLGVGFSPDGRYVVSGGVEVFTRLWNRTNAQHENMFPGHGAGTEAATFSPNGLYVLTTFGGPIHSARLWKVATGQVEREFFGHTGWPLAAVFSPDGQRIATGAQDGTARLWDVATGAQIRVFNSPGTWVRAVAVSTNGTLASGSSDGVARLWSIATGQLLHSFEMNAGSVVEVAFSPASGDLLVAWADGFIRVFDPATGELQLDSVTPAAFLEAIAQRVERVDMEGQLPLRARVNQLAELVAVARPRLQQRQDEELGGAALQLAIEGSRVHICHEQILRGQ